MLTRVLLACLRPMTTARGARTAWRAVREISAEGLAPRSSLNRPIGPDRRATLVRGRLDLGAEIAHGYDATINDVSLTAVAGGRRGLARSRGNPFRDVVLRALVPVSLHGQPRGAADGFVIAFRDTPRP